MSGNSGGQDPYLTVAEPSPITGRDRRSQWAMTIATRPDPLVERMRSFGTTIFAEMSALAVRTGAVNLGQGFPDSDGPPQMLDAAVEAIRAGRNQYPPGPGIPELRSAVSEQQRRSWGLMYDAETEIVITAGATGGIAA